MLGKIKGRSRRGRQRRRWLDGITDATDMNLGKPRESEDQGGLACCSPWGDKESGTTGRNNNTATVLGRICLVRLPLLYANHGNKLFRE